MIKKHIPNFITCLNLFSGCIAITFAFKGQLEMAGYFIFAAAFFDFLDGLAARTLQAFSPLGADLDSLADVVSFGVAPAAIMYQLLTQATADTYIPYLAFILPVFGALRLARFNTDPGQSENFLGLPIPSAGIFVAAIPMAYEWPNVYILLGVIAALSAIMVSTITLFSLKFKNRSWKDNQFKYYLLIASLLLLPFFKFAAIPTIIGLYVGLSILKNSLA